MQIGISGNIGAGKSTLTQRLADFLNLRTFREEFEDLPLLQAYYDDLEAWAYTFQNYVLHQRFGDHLISSQTGGILDRTFWENDIFFNVLATQKKLGNQHLSVLRKRYELLHQCLPRPNFIFHLQASADKLFERIRTRGRKAEAGITLNYLQALNREYDRFACRPEFSGILHVIEVSEKNEDQVFDEVRKILESTQS